MNEVKSTKRGRAVAAVGTSLVVSALSLGLGAAPASAAGASAKSVCSGSASGALLKWGPVSKQCSYTSPASGWKGKLKVSWKVQESTNQYACVQARMGKAKNPDKWQSVGCGQSGSGSVKWPANSASNLEVRAQARPNSPLVNVDYSI
ncbi:hypothetical protein [Sciscionella sediminilitoris]|uniref:hypothetical protein n=1 Tax=Sciscionella sediminilitoris TaxID=1445613 RepID=UPI0004DF8ECC|nr:hypothetical protein [Sciscionella sp. SE31]